MQKVPTPWKANPAKNADSVQYSLSLITYNSPVTPFSSATTNISDTGKVAGSWAKPVDRIATPWQANPAANTNLYQYDMATKTYDSPTDTYDGIVSGQDFDDQNSPTPWSSL